MAFAGAPSPAAVAEEGTPVQGCCLTMCPPEEVRRRQKHKLVHILECRPPSQDPRMPPPSRHEPLLGSSELFVKEYSRSAAGQENASSTVRPLPVLSRTVRYLLADALERRDVSAALAHEFVADRLRAVVKDITLQDLLRNTRTATVLAACVRYHALYHYRMCSSREQSFDAFTHRQQMEGVLLSLVRHYHDQDKNAAGKAEPRQEQLQYSFDFDDDDEDNLFVPGQATDSTSSDDGDDGSVENQRDNADVSVVSEKMIGLNLHFTGEGSRASEIPTIDTPTLAKEEKTAGIENDRTNQSNATNEADSLYTPSSLDTHHSVQSNRWTNISTTSVESLQGDNILDEHSVTEPQLTSTLNNDDITSLIDPIDNFNRTPPEFNCLTERQEMECAYLLFFFNSSEALQHGLELPESLRKQPLLSSVLAALVSLQSTGNFIPVMRLLRSLPPILACYLLVNFKQLQLKALQVLSMGHSSRNTRYPLGKLVALLEFADETEAKRICQLCHLKIVGENQDFVSFQKEDFESPNGALDGPSRRDWLDTQLSAINICSLLMPYPLPLH